MITPQSESPFDKEKSEGRPGREFPVTFVVDQQLEACLDSIEHFVDQPDFIIKIPYNARKDDSVAFSAVMFHDGVALSRIKGTLRRWGGTSTRVEATMTALNALPKLSQSEFLMAVGIFSLYIVIPIITLAVAGRNAPWRSMFPYILGFSIVPAGLLFHVLRKIRIRRKHIRRLRDAITAEPESVSDTDGIIEVVKPVRSESHGA